MACLLQSLNRTPEQVARTPELAKAIQMRCMNEQEVLFNDCGACLTRDMCWHWTCSTSSIAATRGASREFVVIVQ
jgi:hypothetical protein